jgi:hypothetical protein
MAARQAYSVYIIPDAHRLAIQVGFALVNGENPTNAPGFGRECNTSGDIVDPATHWAGGMWTNEAWETQIGNMAVSPPSPGVGGWPITRVEGPDIYEADVVAAAEALLLYTLVTQDGSSPSPETAMNAALATYDPPLKLAVSTEPL